MKALDALNKTDDIASSQRGYVTSAQALAVGVGRMELSRLAARGHLERVGRGVYRAAGAPSIREEEVWCAWLSLEPAVLAYERDPLTHVVSRNTVTWLMDLGELNPEPVTFTSAVRRQVKRDGLRIVRGRLEASEVHTVAGLPCTTAARTVYDLVADGEDLSLISSVLHDALSAGIIYDEASLQRDIDGLGKRLGLAGGMSLYEMLMRG